MRRAIIFSLLVAVVLAACETQLGTSSDQPQSARPINNRQLQIVTGQRVYVPAYSEIFFGSASQTIPLTVTLAIHNADLDTPIIIQSVRYYDTEGQLVRNFVEDPLELAPIATNGFVIEENDTSAGWGANFIVEWVAEEPVYEPVIEAVMVSARGTHGISLLSVGRVLSEIRPDSAD